jgi:predicted dehydrogenase
MSGASGVVRWAIVGTGGIAGRTVGDLALTVNAEVVAVASRDHTRARAFADAHGIPLAFGDYDALLGSGEVDAVYIGIPHGLHFEYASRALRAGIHVVCEKPLTMTAAEAEELGRLARAHDTFLMEAMWTKFTPAFAQIRQILADGRIGEPRLMQGGAGFPVPPDGPRRFWVAELGGGALYDLGVYTLTYAHAVFGGPDGIRAAGHIRPDGVDLDEAYTLTWESGAMAQFTNSIVASVPPAVWIGGTAGTIVLGEPLFNPRSLRLVTGTPPAPPTVEEFAFEVEGAGYVPMFREASAAILRGEREHPTHPLAESVAVLRSMESIRDLLRGDD